MSINYKNIENVELLEEIRLNKGNDRMKSIFSDMLNNNTEKAIELINDKNVQYASLFILQDEIKSADIFIKLSERNKHALEITNGLLLKDNSNTKHFSLNYTQQDYSVLRWIWETGYKDDGLNDLYDEVLDMSAIILSKVYEDRNCLPAIEEMIFNRYRKGAFIYDLVWAFFEVADYENLIAVAKRLQSSNPKDVKLARSLLNFIPCIGLNSKDESIKEYKCALKWLNQNKNFLYYTGATCLQTSNPYRYAISLEGKYLQKGVYNANGEISESLSEDESSCLDRFMELDEASKCNLANCSSILYHRSKYKWRKWLQNAIDKQIEIAKRIMEEHNDKNSR